MIGLRIVRGGEIFLEIDGAGQVAAFCGHVDLGTGIGTALAQIVAEELDVGLDAVTIALGDTERTPDQGPTIASETIQIAAVPLRQAAATARRTLLALAGEMLGVAPEALEIADGVVRAADGNGAVGFGELLRGKSLVVAIDEAAPTKPVSAYRIVGHAAPRRDLPGKATGALTYVHDVRVPGMVHGRVVRPPYAGFDSGEFVGRSLIGVDEGSVAYVPGLLGVVTRGDFVGVVAEREEHAAEAAGRLVVRWRPAAVPDPSDVAAALLANPSTPRLLLERGDVDAVPAMRMQRRYVWPYQLHGSIGPSCAVAEWRSDGLTVWSGTQNPHALRADLAELMGMALGQVAVIRLEAAGCYGRNCADDVAGDAALLSQAVGRPVRVQLTREQEHVWEPKGAAQLVDVDGGLDAQGDVAAYDVAVRYPSNGAPLLAALLTGVRSPEPAIVTMGDRTAVPPYAYPALRVIAHDMAPIARAAWLRGVSALPNTFAHECWIDEAATAAGVDPVAYRLRHLTDPRAVELVRATADRAGWRKRTGPGTEGGDGDVLRGRGFAYAVYLHGAFPGTAAAWSAWVADVDVNTVTGDVAVTRVTVGQDSGLMINPDGVRHQIHGNVIQSVSRVLKEEVRFTATGVATRDWGTYPIMTFPELPPIDVLMVPRPEQPPLGVGESATVPSAAAIANAIHDATGVRFYEAPFTPERVLAGLRAAGMSAPAPTQVKVKRGFWAALGAGAAGLVLSMLPVRGAIAPVVPDASVYSAATIARGKTLASLGACLTCHTLLGRAIETPFGRVWATNITPDVATGIGAWSLAAFVRAMRDGVARDGRHLLPAFPYTDFAKASDADLEAVYAYLMTRAPVRAVAPKTKLRALRPLMAGWNLLFHDASPFIADPTQSSSWNRGAYLVEGLGHCGACHTPRNALGAERASWPFAGGVAEGWDAPPLTARSAAAIPWSEAELFAYLRTGFSALHGPASGPMAPVVGELRALSDTDIRAMATYLASLQGAPIEPQEERRRAAEIGARNEAAMRASAGAGSRIYQGACAACHEANGVPAFGVRPNLAFNSNLRTARPDNLIRVLLQGIPTPARAELGAMPSFAGSLADGDMADLLGFLRAQFAPDLPAWSGLEARVASLRGAL